MNTKRFLTLSVMATILVASCAKETNPAAQETIKPDTPAQEQGSAVVNPDGTISLTFASEATSKTSLRADGKTVDWVQNDAIRFYGDFTDEDYYEASAKTAGHSTEFTNITVPGDLDALYVTYPAGIASGYEDGTLSIVFPSTLDVSDDDGEFANMDFSVAQAVKTDGVWNTSLTFKNVASLLRISITDDEINQISIQGLNNEPMSGTLPVSFNASGELVFGTATSTSNKVNLNIDGAGEYFIPVLPGTVSEGFRVTLYKGATPIDPPFTYLSSFTLAAGQITKLTAVDEHNGQFYVKPDGAGNKSGVNWNNAMSAAQFKDFVEDGDNHFLIRNAIFHLSAEEFTFGDYVQPDFSGHGEVAFTIEGTNSGTDITTFIGGSGDPAGMLWPKASTNVTVKNVKFTGTNGNSNRAAIRVNTSSAKLSLDHCVFEDNATTGNAGAIYLNKGLINIADCEFTDNSAGLGAAIFIELPTVTITGCTFSGNQATSNSDDKGGGAIYMNGAGATVTIDDCTFTGNQATKKCGGAISAPKCENTNSLTITNSTFTNNYAKGWGGAILYKATGSLDISNTTFSGNYSGGDSGAINTDISTFTFDNVTFTGNHADGDFGGVMWADTGDYTFSDCVFDSNYTVKGGGVIYIHSAGNYSFMDCDFIDNHADMGGGAVCIVDGDAVVSFTGGKFQGNHADGDGLNNGQNDDSIISAGGAIYARGAGVTFDCTDVLFKENYTYVSGTNNQIGGIIRVQQNDGLARFNKCLFDGNYTIRNFQDNAAAAAIITCRIGGVKYYFNACEFKENTSGLGYSDNPGNKQGGCKGTVIASYRASKIYMNNCSMHDNYGARNNDEISWIYVDNSGNTLLISNSTIVGDPTRCNGVRRNDWGVIKLHTSGNYYLINNILCSFVSKTDSQTVWCGASGTNVFSYYNKTTPEVDGRINWGTDTGSGHDYIATSASFGSWSSPWTWNGTLTGTNSNMKAATADVNTQIQNADADFYAWLNSIGALGKDINGNNRGATSWPGCYQN